MAKMGRPKSDDSKEYRVTIRFSNAERKLLEAYAEKCDLTKVQVLLLFHKLNPFVFVGGNPLPLGGGRSLVNC